jgi:hypothetical protein
MRGTFLGAFRKKVLSPSPLLRPILGTFFVALRKNVPESDASALRPMIMPISSMRIAAV